MHTTSKLCSVGCAYRQSLLLYLYTTSLSIGLTILPRAQLHTFLLLHWLSERRHLSPTAASSESKVHLPSLSPLTPFLSSSSSSCYWCVCCCCDKDCLNWGDTSRSSGEQIQFRTAPDPTPCSAAWLADWWSTARPPAAASANLGPEWPLEREGKPLKPTTSTCIFLQRTVRLWACAARLTVIHKIAGHLNK